MGVPKGRHESTDTRKRCVILLNRIKKSNRYLYPKYFKCLEKHIKHHIVRKSVITNVFNASKFIVGNFQGYKLTCLNKFKYFRLHSNVMSEIRVKSVMYLEDGLSRKIFYLKRPIEPAQGKIVWPIGDHFFTERGNTFCEYRDFVEDLKVHTPKRKRFWYGVKKNKIFKACRASSFYGEKKIIDFSHKKQLPLYNESGLPEKVSKIEAFFDALFDIILWD